MAELDVAGEDCVFGDGGIGSAVVDGRLLAQQFVDALDGGCAALEDVDHPAHRDDRPDEQDHVGVEGDELARR